MEMQLSLESQSIEISGKSLSNEDDPYFNSFPVGYRFQPHDEEIIVHYLKPKVLNKPLSRNRIKEVEFYKHNPATLAASCKPQGEKEWYFFTPRDRKYQKGQRPNRVVDDGYWKATGADKAIKFQGRIVGYKKVLVFFRGKPRDNEKTDWIMHEYRVDNLSTHKKIGDDMRLDDWVLCKLYLSKRNPKNSAIPLRNQRSPHDEIDQLPPNQESSHDKTDQLPLNQESFHYEMNQLIPNQESPHYEIDQTLDGISLDELDELFGNMM